MSIGLISNQQTFIDLTDANDLEVSVASNLPTVQIKDNNKTPAEYSPSWEIINLILTPTIFLNSKAIDVSECTITWKRQDGASTAVALIAGETVSNGILTVNINSLATSASGIITYICDASTADGFTATASVSFSLIASGATATSDNASVTFQLYAPNGYVLSNSVSSLTLQTMAYVGSTQIQLGEATYKWYEQNGSEWTLVQEGTSSQFIVTRDDINQFKNYKCDMTYNGNIYTSTLMVEDKSDVYNAMICISNNVNVETGDYYWIVYTLVYNQDGEIDPLLGPISVVAPEDPSSDDYWYSVDTENEMIVLKQYNGTEWVDSVDFQSLLYYWSMITNDGDDTPIGEAAKVQIISCHDFTSTATFKCDVSAPVDGLIAMCTLTLHDVSDPIVSSTAPTNASDGQIWIKKNANGTYLMFVWDAAEGTWVSSNTDSQSKIYTSRPTEYNAGDLWITNSDDDHGKYLQGTLLQAQVSNSTYNADDWAPTLKYDADLEEIQGELNNLSQYVRINSNGLQIGARTSTGEISPFTSLFTSTELAFYQNSDKLLTLANNKLIAPKVEIEDSLIVDGYIRLGDLRLIIEDNGSYSFSVLT